MTSVNAFNLSLRSSVSSSEKWGSNTCLWVVGRTAWKKACRALSTMPSTTGSGLHNWRRLREFPQKWRCVCSYTSGVLTMKLQNFMEKTVTSVAFLSHSSKYVIYIAAVDCLQDFPGALVEAPCWRSRTWNFLAHRTCPNQSLGKKVSPS